MNIKEEVKKLIIKCSEQQDLRVENTTDLLKEEILDSLALAKLISEIEAFFPIEELDPDDISPENFTSVDTIAHLISRRLSDGRG